MIENYNIYILNAKEKRLYYVAGGIALIAAAILFFNSIKFAILLLPILFYGQNELQKMLADKRMKKLRSDLVDFLYSISSSVASGLHMRDALKEAETALEEGALLREIKVMNGKIESLNMGEKQLLADFAQRSGIEELKNFTDSYYACRDAGGDLTAVISRGMQVITDKLMIERDMKTLIAQKVFEGKLIAALPLVVILCLRLASPDYLLPLYESGAGRIIMGIALCSMVFAFCYAKKLQKVVFREDITSALPEFLSRLSLMLNSGMVLQTALERLGSEGESGNLLLKEFQKLSDDAAKERVPVLRKLRDFAMKEKSRELLRICGIMTANMDRGTELSEKLDRESEFLWHMAKKSVEEKSRLAETKMAFPMALMLLVLILITLAPVMMTL